jgi:transmembrane sensor
LFVLHGRINKRIEIVMSIEIDTDIDITSEKALQVMETNTELSEDEMRKHLKDKSCKEVCKDILDSTSILLQNETKQLDVEAELAKFKKKHTPMRYHFKKAVLYNWGIGIAAMIAIFFSIYNIIKTDKDTQLSNDKGFTVFRANNIPRQVTLQSGHTKIVVNKNSASIPQLEKQISSLDGNMLSSGEGTAISTRTLNVSCGQDFKLVLADGSEVWLNANTRFVYPVAFNGNERTVFLEGEAYFKIAKDQKHPFIVKTRYAQTVVYGTEFNVKCYNPNDTHVVLISGSVGIYNLKNNSYKKITPGDDAQVLSNGDFNIEKVDIDSYLYWKDGYFYFDKESLKNVMQSIGRWYNVTVEFKNIEDMNLEIHFTGGRSMGLKNIVRLLNRMKKVNFTLDGNKVIVG